VSDDFFVDDLFGDEKPKKKAEGGRKGKRVERSLSKLLTERFGKAFSRSVGSGNRWGQIANMPKHATETFSGDICCPEGFLWVLESKGGYEKIDLNAIFVKGNSQLDEFLEQVEKEATRAKRKPMLLWKKDRKPWLAFLYTKELEPEPVDGIGVLPLTWNFKYRLIYNIWSVVALGALLELPDSFFFSNSS